MSEIPLSETPRIQKITELVCEQINENVARQLGDSLVCPPTLKSMWVEEGVRDIGWKYVTDLKPNVTIQVGLKLKGYPFSDLTALIKGVTIENMLFLPSSVEYGTVTDGIIPAGLSFYNEGYGSYHIDVIPNADGSPPTPHINPFAELIRLEASEMIDRYNRSKLIRYMHDLKRWESWEGVPGFAGRNKKYLMQCPRVFTAIPFGSKTILSVSTVLKMSYEQKVTIEEMGKKVKVKIVAPRMSEIDLPLKILSQLDYYIKHIGYTIETTGNFQVTELLDGIKGLSLMLPSILSKES